MIEPFFQDWAIDLAKGYAEKSQLVDKMVVPKNFKFCLETSRLARTNFHETACGYYWDDDENQGAIVRLGTGLMGAQSLGNGNLYCYSFAREARLDKLIKEEDGGIKKVRSPNDYSTYLPVYPAYKMHLCPCCGKRHISENYPAQTVPENYVFDTINLEQFLIAAATYHKAKNTRQTIRRCNYCREKALYWNLENRVKNNFATEKEIKFLQFRLWKKYKLSKVTRKLVKKAALRHYRKHYKKLTPQEQMFFQVLLGANAIKKYREEICQQS